MDWIDQAAKKFNDDKEEKKRLLELEEKLKAEFPEHLMRLWLMFEEVFDKVKERFGENCRIKRINNSLEIVIGDVRINANAEQGSFFGGYFGKVNLYYTVDGPSNGPELAINELLLYDIENPRWVYLMNRNGSKVQVDLVQLAIEEIFKTALWKYLR